MPISIDSWIKDGSTTTVPVTDSTPVVDTGAAATVADSATQVARDEQGRFVSTPSSTTEGAASSTPAQGENTPAVATPATAVTSAPTSETVAAVVEEFIEARRGDKPYQIPKDVLLPWKHGKQNGYAPVTEVLASDMQERDYRQKTQAAAEQRRQNDITAARLQAREEALKTEAEALRSAMLDPEKLEQYNAHFEMMAKNPLYRKQVEDAQASREDRAELAIIRENEQQEVLRASAESLRNTIRETGSQYPGVDPERAIEIYRKGLISGDIKEINEDSIHQVYKQEADYSNRLVAPLQAEMTALKAQVAALTGAKAVEAHNASTDKKLAQAKAAPVVAATGSNTAVGPSNQPTAFKPFTDKDYPDKIREWSKVR